MEGTCHYCGSGTSMLERVELTGGTVIKVCPDCEDVVDE